MSRAKRNLTIQNLRHLQSLPPASPSGKDPIKGKVASLSDVRSFINSQNLSSDTIFLGEMLYQLMARIDAAMFVWESQQHILARVEATSVTTTEGAIYENTFPYPVSLVVYNLDPAQTCFIGGKGLTTSNSLPIFPETSERYTVEAGRRVYGVVAAGSIDVRFYITQRRIVI